MKSVYCVMLSLFFSLSAYSATCEIRTKDPKIAKDKSFSLLLKRFDNLEEGSHSFAIDSKGEVFKFQTLHDKEGATEKLKRLINSKLVSFVIKENDQSVIISTSKFNLDLDRPLSASAAGSIELSRLFLIDHSLDLAIVCFR